MVIFYLQEINTLDLFDKFDYKIREDKLDPSKIVGFHVISVVGWGVDKEVDEHIGKKPGTNIKLNIGLFEIHGERNGV